MNSINTPLLDAPSWLDQTIPSLIRSNDRASHSKILEPVSPGSWWNRPLRSIVNPILVLALLLLAVPTDDDGQDEFRIADPSRSAA